MRFFALLTLIAVLSAAALAQSTDATVTGRVVDPTGAVVVHARVVFTNLETNLTSTTKTNGEGVYTLSTLRPGSYRLEVSMPGFKTILKPDVVLHVQDVLAINFALAVGSASESITVEAGASQVSTESSSVSTVVDRQFVANLPLNGRSFEGLFQMTPGVNLSPVTPSSQGQFAINGQRPDGNYFMVDGVSANIGVASSGAPDSGMGGGLPSVSAVGGTTGMSSVDAVQEFRIQTSTFAPQFGRAPGGQVQVVTRSGTNQFHGTAFEYLRNTALDANDWFANYNRLPRVPEKMNDFGGVLGGPIIRDRTFFFFSYEGFRLRQSPAASTYVPDICLRGGPCSAALTAAGIVPAPAALQPILNAFPLPNAPEVAALPGIAQFNADVPNSAGVNSTSIRVDHSLSSRLTIFGRFLDSPSVSRTRAQGVPANETALRHTDAKTVTGGLTWIVSPTIVSDLHLNYSHFSADLAYVPDDYAGAVVPPDSALLPGGQSLSSSYASFNLDVGGNTIFSSGFRDGNVQRQVNIIENLHITKGAHDIQVGFDYRHLSPTYGPQTYMAACVFLSGVKGVETGSCDHLTASQYSRVTLKYNNYSLYAQDTWKAGRRLTLTYGLRWDVNPPPTTVGPQFLAVTQVTNPGAFALASKGTPIYGTRYGSVAPRLGMTYALSRNPKWQNAIRGGYGFFYDTGAQNTAFQASYQPFVSTAVSSAVPYPFPAAAYAAPSLSMTPPFSNFFAYDPNFKVPMVQEWNVTFQQALGASQSVNVSYNGSSGRNLTELIYLDTVPKTFSTGLVTLLTNGATSDYNALQLQYQHLLTRRLKMLASYAWAHSIDTLSSDNNVNLPAEIVPPSSNRGSSDFDTRQTVSGSATYDLPMNLTGVLGSIGDNWGLDTIFSARTPLPVNIQTYDGLTDNLGDPIAVRPNLNPGVPLYLNGAACAARGAIGLGGPPACPGGMAINPAAFSTPSAPGQGNLGRNIVRGFSFYQWDLSLRRKFNLRERTSLTFRVDAFNLLNHPVFGIPTAFNTENYLKTSNTSLPYPKFGVATASYASFIGESGVAAINPLFAPGSPRSFQVSLKLSF